jgi:hypothetical protein
MSEFQSFSGVLEVTFKTPRWWTSAEVIKARYSCKYRDTKVPRLMVTLRARTRNGRLSFYSMKLAITSLEAKDVTNPSQ